MASQPTRPTLMEHLAGQEMGRLAQKHLFGGGYDVPFLPLLMTGLWLFQKGAVLGRVRRDRLELLAKMFSQPGRERDVSELLHSEATDRMRKYGKEPDSFLDFWLQTGVPTEMDFRDLRVMKALSRSKTRLGRALPWAAEWVLDGMAFGCTYPELTEKLWREGYETADPESWALARRAGVDLPEQETRLPLGEMEQQVLLEVAQYATEYFPELVEPLGLRLA